jgi:hypothetical protein
VVCMLAHLACTLNNNINICQARDYSAALL